MEAYIARHSEADFSHGYCPECFDKAMTDLRKHRSREYESEVAV